MEEINHKKRLIQSFSQSLDNLAILINILTVVNFKKHDLLATNPCTRYGYKVIKGSNTHTVYLREIHVTSASKRV